MPNLTPNFYDKLVKITSELGMKPEDLLNVMALESGLNPAAHNKNGNASGLVQFMPSTLKGMGYKGSHDEFRGLSGEDQLDYVKRLIQGNMKFNGGPFTSAPQYYVANFWPVGLKLPGIKAGDDAAVIVEKNPESVTAMSKDKKNPGEVQYSKKYMDVGFRISVKSEIAAYNANPGLDTDKDGKITFADLKVVLKRATGGKNYLAALEAMKNATGYEAKPQEQVASNVRSVNTQPDNVRDISTAPNKPSDPGKSWYNLHDNHSDGFKGLMMPNSTAPSENYNIDTILNSYVSQIAASEKVNRSLYNKFLPKQKYLIQIQASNYTNAVEASRVLSAALEEDLLATSTVYTNGNEVEIESSIPGPSKECFAALVGITESFEDAFKIATKKIGEVSISTNIIVNAKSSYPEITLKTAEIQHNKFLLKFV